LPSDEVTWIQLPDYFELLRRTHQKIASRAYEIWQESGFSHGHDIDDWYQAIAELTPWSPDELVVFIET
jgi:hypothetical protein